jgi:drug/metabolite transporter (DMT)-like permease
MASALALGLQIWGQRQVGPSRTSLLLMIEPVSAAMIGAIIGEHLGWAAAAGAGLILAGIAVAELWPLLPPRNADSCAMLAVAEGTRSA